MHRSFFQFAVCFPYFRLLHNKCIHFKEKNKKMTKNKEQRLFDFIYIGLVIILIFFDDVHSAHEYISNCSRCNMQVYDIFFIKFLFRISHWFGKCFVEELKVIKTCFSLLCFGPCKNFFFAYQVIDNSTNSQNFYASHSKQFFDRQNKINGIFFHP